MTRTVTEQLAFRCAHHGGKCNCDAGACALGRALEQTPPPCSRCGRQTRLEDRFRLDHEAADGPGVTMQLVEIRRDLEDAGVQAWGAEVIVYYCEPCDLAEVSFFQEAAA